MLATIETTADFEFDIEKRIMKIPYTEEDVQKFLSGFVLKNMTWTFFYRNERK